VKRKLSEHPIHLGLGATATMQPEFTGDMDWYAIYSAANAADGAEGRLVSQHSFTESWASWEMHPNGSEVVLCMQGRISLIQQLSDGSLQTVVLKQGEYAINPPGVWHTADLTEPATAIFITAGEGTQHKPR
jgi:mannose-6-phosphate isomerase-like protein (cupin superfamily)